MNIPEVIVPTREHLAISEDTSGGHSQGGDGAVGMWECCRAPSSAEGSSHSEELPAEMSVVWVERLLSREGRPCVSSSSAGILKQLPVPKLYRACVLGIIWVQSRVKT